MPRLRVEKELLGSCLAAAYLGLHRNTLEAWRRRGEIVPTVTGEGPQGPRYLYSRADLEQFRNRIDYNV